MGKKKKNQPKNLPLGMGGPSQAPSPRQPQPSAPRPAMPSTGQPPAPRQAMPSTLRPSAPRQAQSRTVPPPAEEPRGASGGDIEGVASLSITESPDDMMTSRAVSPDRLGYSKEIVKLIGNMPRKPRLNKSGRPIQLVTNLYPLKYPAGYVYHYDVEILTVGRQSTTTMTTKMDKSEKKFRCLSTKLNREVFQELIRTSPLFKRVGAVYDGMKNAITNEKLNIPYQQVHKEVVEWGESRDKRKFVVQIQAVEKESGGCEISLDLIREAMEGRCPAPREAIAALEIILKHSACLRHIPIMNNFFSPSELSHPLTSLSEVWFGYHQSVRLASKGPVVNLNTSATVFYKPGPLLNYLEFVFGRDLKNLVWDEARYNKAQRTKNFKDLRVKTTHQVQYQRKRKICGFTKKSADQQMFQIDGVPVSVRNYFRDKYQVTLRYPNLPCIVADNPTKNIYIPVELCEVVEGQRCKDRDLWMPSEMIKVTADPADKKFRKIFEIREKKTLFDQDPSLRDFGLQVSHTPLEVEGRKLVVPSVQYHGQSGDPVAKPAFGAWNLRDRKFLIGSNITSWVMISFVDVPRNNLEKFARELTKFANIQGMYMGACREIQTHRAPRYDKDNQVAFESFLERNFSMLKSVQLAVLVIPDKDNSMIYTLSKQAADKVGFTLQCVQRHNVVPPPGRPGPSPSLICNILLKINAKMGGVNSSLRVGEMPSLMREIMFLGADVTHPSPLGDIPCSIAAVVASMDPDFAKYEVEVRAQKHDCGKESREVIRNFQSICLNLLNRYREINKKLPKGVVVYRDGVSDGEVPIVQEQEVDALQRALRSLGHDSIPIVYIVVQKRHNVRMMPKDPRDGDRNTKNPPPGTLADSVITHPFLYDFYMYPHNGLKGTSKPIYCMVVRDNFKISPEDLHNMTFYLCHLYAPCTKSISMPAPVRYADKAAFIARARLESKFGGKFHGDDHHVDLAAINLHLALVQFKHVV